MVVVVQRMLEQLEQRARTVLKLAAVEAVAVMVEVAVRATVVPEVQAVPRSSGRIVTTTVTGLSSLSTFSITLGNGGAGGGYGGHGGSASHGEDGSDGSTGSNGDDGWVEIHPLY